MVKRGFVKSNLLAILGLVGCLAAVAHLAGCGGVSTEGTGEQVTTTVIVECLIEGSEEFLDVPADVVVGGVRGQTNLQDNWVILEGVPLGSASPPQQPLTATAPGYVTASQTLTLNEFSYTTASVPMTPADPDTTGTVAGTVTDVDTGQPLINALVSFEGTVVPASDTVLVKGFTDQGGFYVVGGIPAGSVEVACQAVGYLEDAAALTVVADSVGENDRLNFALFSGESTITVSGQVLEIRTEAVVAGATVQIGDQLPVVSELDGSFSVSGVGVGEQPVLASAEGYDDYYTVINVLPGIEPLRILLTEFSPQPPGDPYTITGRVTLLGAPDNSGAVVTALELDRGVVLGQDTTDTDGYYYLFVPPGDYRIEVTYGDHTIGREVELLGGGRVLENINFTLTVN